ncbi:MAG: hypothetical protein VB137_04620 [Burkholderia sp.]
MDRTGPPGLGRRAGAYRRRALRLSCAERAYLFDLAAQSDPAEPELATAGVPDTLVAALAYVLDRQWNALAAALVADWLDGEHDRNLLRFTFLSRAARADRRLGYARAAPGGRIPRQLDPPLNDAPTRGLIDALLAGSEAFAHYWASRRPWSSARAANAPSRIRATRHLVYQQTTLKLAHREDLKFVVLIPGAPAEAGQYAAIEPSTDSTR